MENKMGLIDYTYNIQPSDTAIPHKLLLKVLLKVINFTFKSKDRKHIGFSKTSIY